MADTIKIGNLDISAFKVGSSDCKIYLGTVLLYPQSPTPPTPTGSTCYEVISTPITSYTSTTYDSVFTYKDTKWYMKNNINQYEEYGIYDSANTLSSLTYYEGKLAVIGETEYQYSGGSWSVVGSYAESSVTYTIDDTYPSPYVGQELATTFKIPYAEVESISMVEFSIRGDNNDELNVMIESSGEWTDYSYRDSEWNEYSGEITEDGEYFYLSLPSEAPQSIVISEINYLGSESFHLIATSKQLTVKYEEKDVPLAKAYSSVADMELDVCPTVGIGQYGVVGNNAYKFSNNEEWAYVSDVKFIGGYGGEVVNVIECGSSSSLTQLEVKPTYITSSITNVYLGNCITYIEYGAFQNCTSLTTLSIPNSVTNIGNSVFYGCTNLVNIDMPSGLTSLGQSVFYNCQSLRSISIPDGVTAINQTVFSQCRSLSSCTFGNGVRTIGNGAFQNAGLVSLHIPSGVTSISANAFTSCASLTSITVDSNNSVYDSRNNCNALIKTSTNELIVGCRNTTIPNGVTTIGNSAFVNCYGLTGNLDIPNSVTTIGSNAFRPCSGLTSITIGTGISSIGLYAFYGCSSLTSITINATTPPTLSDANAFTNTNNCPIYVPCGSVDRYKAASRWSSLASRITCVQPKTLQWVTFNNGDTIPSDLEIYGVSGLASNLVSTFMMYGDNIEFTDEGRGKCSVHIGWMEYRYCYEEDGLSMSSNLEYIFSNISNSCKLDSYTVSNGVTVGGTIKLYIYA